MKFIKRIKKIKICTICGEKEAFILQKSLVTGSKNYICVDCLINQGELYKEFKEFKQKKEPWAIR